MDYKEHISAFLSSSKTDKNLSKRTIKAYCCDLKLFNDYIISKSFSSIETDQIREYLNTLQNNGLKANSIKRKLATLKVFFSFLIDEGILLNSPIDKIRGKFKTPKRLPRTLSKEEVQKLLKQANIISNSSKINTDFKRYQLIRNRLIIELLFSTGMRIDEISKLNISDIDISENTIIIYGKGCKERIVYISSNEVMVLIKYYLSIRVQLSSVSKSLLLNNRSKRLSVHSVSNIFGQIVKECKFQKHFTPHCLRHTMATMLIENGADVRSVQEILGHSSISTTEIYISVNKKRKKEVMDKFNGRNNLVISK